MTEMALERRKILGFDGFQIKLFALIAMTMDHLAAYLPVGVGIPDWFHLIGRFAAPLFLFFCAEGIYYTRNRARYMLRLYVGWVLMTLGNHFITTWFAHPDGVILMNGMFGTMLLVVLTVSSIEALRSGRREHSRKKIWLGIAGFLYLVGSVVIQLGVYLGMAGLIDPVTGTLSNPAMLPVVRNVMRIVELLLPNLLTVEGSIAFVVLGVAFYYLRRWRLAQIGALGVLCLIQLAVQPQGWLTYLFVFLAAIPMYFYNGQPGSRRHGGLFYWYYPLHIYVIYITGFILMTQFGI